MSWSHGLKIIKVYFCTVHIVESEYVLGNFGSLITEEYLCKDEIIYKLAIIPITF